jgi:hypothetical protein
MGNKNKLKNKRRAQSAVDYLMTYGWAILIIVAVILILFKLGVFSSGSLTGSACVGTPGFLCTIPTMNSSGYLSASIGSATESIDILAVGCSASDSAPPSTNFTYLSKSIKLPPQSSVIQLFHCPLPANSPLGTPFTGTLWIKYNTQYVSSQVSEVGSLVAKVDTVGSLSYTGSKILPTSFYLTMGIIPNNGGIVTPGSGSYNTATTVSISATPNSGYIFDGWLGSGSGNYNGTSNTATVTMNGNITETATFIKPNTILFVDPGLPLGTSWGVTFNGVTNSTTGNFVSFTENTPGNYPYYVDYVSSYAPTVLNSTVDFVNYNVIDVNFSKVYHIAPYQQLVTFSPTSYSTYESSDLGNIRFYYKSIQTYNNITELNSWCESGCSSSASQARFLVLLPNDVNVTEPNGNITSANIILDMYFSNTPQYSGVHAGEAPQLSSTYGEYDNGGRVFNYYTNFAGNALPTNWASAGGANYIVNDGITIYPGGTNDGSNADDCTGGVFDTQGFITANYMEDFYGNVIGSTISSYCDTAGVGVSNLSSAFPPYPKIQNINKILWFSTSLNPVISSATASSGAITTNYASGQNNVFTLASLTCPHGSIDAAFANYNVSSVAGMLSQTINPYYININSQHDTSLTLNIKWLGFRSFPPIGTYPQTTTGNLQSSSNGNYLPVIISMQQAYASDICNLTNTTIYSLLMKELPSNSSTLLIPFAGTHLYSKGSKVTINEIPKPNYVFGGWVGSGINSYTGSSSESLVTMNSNIVETAIFNTWNGSANGPLNGYTTKPAQSSYAFGGTLSGSASGKAFGIINNALVNTTFSSAQLNGPFNGTNIAGYECDYPTYFLLSNATGTFSGSGISGTWTGEVNGSSCNNKWGGILSGVLNGTYLGSPMFAMINSISLTGSLNPTINTTKGTIDGTWSTANAFGSWKLINVSNDNIIFTESILPSGTKWNVTFNGNTLSSTSSYITFPEGTNGNYLYTIGNVVNYVAVPKSGYISFTSPTPVIKFVPFVSTFNLVMNANPSDGGTVTPGNGIYVMGSAVTINAIPNSGYIFYKWSGTGWGGDYSGTSNTARIIMDNNTTETATFIPYNSVDFAESGLSSGTVWNVIFNGNSVLSKNSIISFPETVSGTYPFTINALTSGSGCTATPSSGNIIFNAPIPYIENISFSCVVHIGT